MLTTDLGTVLSLASTAILTTYVAGDTIYAGRPKEVRFSVQVVVVAGTLPSKQTTKVQACNGDVSVAANWFDVESEDDTDEIESAPLIEHDLTLNAAGTYNASYSVKGQFKALRLAVKWTTNVGQAGETVIATALAA
jgi:hypothetical protein